jgi:hypothetical protein
MAPAVTIATSDNVPVGDYKEISHGPKAFNKDVEIKGADGHAPAAVCIPQPSCRYALINSLSSILTISLLG